MNKKILFVLTLIISVFYLSTTVSANENRHLVTFKKEIDTNCIKKAGGTVIKEFDSSPSLLIKASNDVILLLKSNKEIKEIKLDKEIEVSEGYNDFDLDSIDIDPQEQLLPWNVDYIDSTYAHKKGINGEGVKVGIIDSGINPHKDLRISGEVNIINTNSHYYDDYGHGTKVAGIIGSLDHSYGIIGVAPGAYLYSIKVLEDNGKGLISDVVSGIEWAIDNELDVINLSLQTTENYAALRMAIEKAYKKI